MPFRLPWNWRLPEDNTKLWKMVASRLFSPHILLILSCGAYIVFGAYVFRRLEGDVLVATKARHLRAIDHDSQTYARGVEALVEENWERIRDIYASERISDVEAMALLARDGGALLSAEARQRERQLVEEISALSREHFDNYVNTVFAAHRSVRHGFEENAPTWDFMNSLFFTATMLTSIGFGYVCPITFEGRLFGVIYCLIGIPLTLVTVANVAKFASESIFMIHYEIWKFWLRFKTARCTDERRRTAAAAADNANDNNNNNSNESGGEPGTGEDAQIFSDSEDEQDVLDRIRLIRFPPIVVFLFAIIYGFVGAFVIQRNEKWSYLEALYYTFISILTVGFGDYRPSRDNLVVVLVVITGGIILTTMCMDVVGRMYLKEIHYLGRKLRTNNPFYMLREAKANLKLRLVREAHEFGQDMEHTCLKSRKYEMSPLVSLKRRRQAMASLLAQLARGMIFAHRNFGELAHKRAKKRDRKSAILPDGQFMFARMAPDPPRDCQVVSTSAYSVRLAWMPAFSASDEKVTYNIRYRLKYQTNQEDLGNPRKVREIKHIQGNSIEIMSIESCSLYEFRITAVSKYGESKPAILVQYTEPQLSPQHILTRKINANTVELTWEPPYKRTKDVKNYMVYWTDNPGAVLADWEKMTVYGRRVVFPELKYDWFYLFCANACFNDGQRSPLSRALFVKTDKLEFKTNCVGHSRTVEVMEAIYDKVEASELSPLLKRDYASFAI